jgi:hypothetical protein
VGFGEFLGDGIFCWLPEEVFRERTWGWLGSGGIETSFSWGWTGIGYSRNILEVGRLLEHSRLW